MADIRFTINCEGYQAEAVLFLKDDFSDLIRRIKEKGSIDPLNEFSYQIASDLITEMTNKCTVRKLVKIIAEQVENAEEAQTK